MDSNSTVGSQLYIGLIETANHLYIQLYYFRYRKTQLAIINFKLLEITTISAARGFLEKFTF